MLTRDWVGINETIPLYAAGRPTDPSVWLPTAPAHIRAATAAADPLLDPPGVCSMFQGLRVGLGSRFANIVVTHLPSMIAPACFNLATASASSVGTKSAKT